MARRSGQVGYEEKKGNWYHARFRIDVPGKEKRVNCSVPICPISGPGALTKPERARRRKEIIAASGADTEEHFNTVEAINFGLTFRKQAEWHLEHSQTRKRKPIKPATADGYRSYLDSWLIPYLGDVPVSSVNNLLLKGLVERMVEAGKSPKMVANVVQLAQMVVASAVNENGEQIHPRKWNHGFMDLPEIKNQRQPVHSSEAMNAIVAASEGREQMLLVLLGAGGMRFAEALGIEVGKHISDGFSKLSIEQQVRKGRVQPFLKTENGLREIDLHPVVAAMLKEFVGNRKSGFLFCSKNGLPLLQSNVLRLSLHPLLAKLGLPQSGAHAFRRFRTTWLRKQCAPEDLIRFWLGHANKTVTDVYSKLKEDVVFRKKVAEQVGIGFELPNKKPAPAPNCTQSEMLPRLA
jgi:integrase